MTRVLLIVAAVALATSALADVPVPRRNPHRPVVTVEPMLAQDTCNESVDAALVERADKRRQIPFAVGQASDGTRVTLWLGRRTWAITATLPSGRTCPVLDGSWWRFFPPKREAGVPA